VLLLGDRRVIVLVPEKANVVPGFDHLKIINERSEADFSDLLGAVTILLDRVLE
jgi:hypothetical protein